MVDDGCLLPECLSFSLNSQPSTYLIYAGNLSLCKRQCHHHRDAVSCLHAVKVVTTYLPIYPTACSYFLRVT